MGGDTRKELRDLGLSIRRQVLGEKYVDNALKSATDFNQPLQDLLNEYCWGAIWGREGLTRKERSMINLAMLTALGRTHEVEVHVRGALKNGYLLRRSGSRRQFPRRNEGDCRPW
jgi:4-carboxymuconolactone decarboxylase